MVSKILVNFYACFCLTSFITAKININGTTRSDIDKSIIHQPKEFLKLYEYWKPICSIRQNNVMLQRRDGCNIDLLIEQIPWSLDHPSIHTFTGTLKKDNISVSSSKPVCQNLEDIKNTLNFPVLEQTCIIPWLSTSSIVHVLNKYAAIIYFGDSLTRHMVFGFYMLLSGDLRFGGYPATALNSEIHRHCACDGQLSENDMCRNFEVAEFMILPDTCTSEFCKRNPALKHVTFGFHDDMIHLQKYKLCSIDPSDTRPILISIQGGTHYRTKSNKFIHDSIIPTINEIHAHLQACPNKIDFNRLRFIFSGVPVVDVRVERKYPDQERSSAARFNREVGNYTDYNVKNSMFLNFWKLTLEATGRTSDGFHSLTDVNLMKMMITLNVMNFLAAP